jgi:AcrR family transcriptional regulator
VPGRRIRRDRWRTTMSLQPNDSTAALAAAPTPLAALERHGRPRSESANRAILEAFRELLIEDGFTRLRLEHVAARAGVSKATIYRRWRSKEELAIELLQELASPFLAIPDAGDTRAELVTVAQSCIGRLTESDFGPVVRAMLCEIAANPSVGDRFRAVVVQTRRDEVRHVIGRGIARGDLPASTDPDIAAELLIGPICFRLVFGGALDREFGEKVVDALLWGRRA